MRAVILGGSIAGLLAAQALTEHVDEVVVVERDRLLDSPGQRPGVPQSVHLHALVHRGLREIEQLVPGFAADLAAAGARAFDFGADTAIYNPAGWSKRFPSSLTIYGASRVLIESVLRDRVLAHPRVHLCCGRAVEGLVGDARTITGVRLQATPIPLDADLVVDATGRGSRARHWLARLGYPPVPEVVIDAHVGYASRQYAIPDRHIADWHACYVQLAAPHRPRGAVLAPVEGNRWMVSLIGVKSHRPTTTEDDFLRFARSLPTPAIAEVLAHATPLTPILATHATSNRRRYVENAHGQPTNLIHLGDAVCSLNPIYAQGMSTAAAAAALLARCCRTRPRSCDLAPRFHRQLARLNNWAWQLATTTDLSWPTTDGGPPTLLQRITDRYAEHVFTGATDNPQVASAVLDVLHLLRPPRSLLAPTTLARTLRATHRGAHVD
ncbi:FAD-dependent oxidoreductase [Nocardia sp. NPDC006044]|uniref:FAD-dependent oxidoreductase n=1 Tax=Nocardia sp. NPDC006044 TaxID=3364306 RepID=UPI0036D083F8